MNRKIITFLLIVQVPFTMFGQTEGNTSLKTVLDSLEKKYRITFTYLDENIEGIYIKPPTDILELTEFIVYLSQQTNLYFNQLNERFITISKKQKIIINVCGFVSSTERWGALEGVTVQSNNKFAITNSKGFFEIKDVPSSDSLVFRSLGYTTIKMEAETFAIEKCPKVFLDVQPTTLSEIVIPDYLTIGISKNEDGSFALNTKSLAILPGLSEPDVLHSIQTLPGIQSINETVSDINVRGGTNDQNLVLWEGIKMYQSGHFFGLISVFNPYVTKSVRVIKNGTTSSLGDGVSSTISIQTDDAITEKVEGGAGVNMLHADGHLKIPVFKNASINVAARRSLGDIVQTPTYTNYFSRAFRGTEVFNSSIGADSLATSNQEFRFYDFSINYSQKIGERDKLKINLLNIYNEINFQENALINNTTESKTSSLNQETQAGSVYYSKLISKSIGTSALLYYSKYDLDAVNENLFENQRLMQQNEVLDWGLKANAIFAISTTSDLSLGYQLSEVGVTNSEKINNPNYSRLVKNVLLTHSIYSDANMSFSNDQARLRTGIRVNYFSNIGRWTVEPRIVYNQKLAGDFSLEIMGEMKSQSTTQIIDFQTDFLGVEKRRWILSNDDDIPLIRSQQASAGIQYDPKNVLVSVETYIKKVKGINSLSQGFQNQYQFVKSSGAYESFGLDLLVSSKLRGINSWASYSYSENAYNFQKFVPPWFPNNLRISHSTSVGATFNARHWELSSGLNWHTGKPFTLPAEPETIIDGKILYDNPNRASLPHYLRIDFSAIYNFKLGNRARAQLGLSLWNLFNRDNTVGLYYVINKDDQIQSVAQSALGFTPNLSFRVKF